MPRDCPVFVHTDFPRAGRTMLGRPRGASSRLVADAGSLVRTAQHALQNEPRAYAACLPWGPRTDIGTKHDERCRPVPKSALSADRWCLFHRPFDNDRKRGLAAPRTLDSCDRAADLTSLSARECITAGLAPPFFSMQAFVAHAGRFQRAWPYPAASAPNHIEDILQRSHHTSRLAACLPMRSVVDTFDRLPYHARACTQALSCVLEIQRERRREVRRRIRQQPHPRA